MIRDVSRFDKWFSESYSRIKSKLRCYLNFNEDAFHDAYLSIRLSLLFERTEILDLEAYFIGCYKKISLKSVKCEQRYCHPEDIFFQLLSDEEPVPVEYLLSLDNLAHDILNFVKKHFPYQDYSLFILKHFDACCPYKDLSDYTGVSSSTIYRRINTINNVVRGNSDFMQRNSQLIDINN